MSICRVHLGGQILEDLFMPVYSWGAHTQPAVCGELITDKTSSV